MALAFEQTDSHVIFTAPTFTHYAFVYESVETTTQTSRKSYFLLRNQLKVSRIWAIFELEVEETRH